LNPHYKDSIKLNPFQLRLKWVFFVFGVYWLTCSAEPVKQVILEKHALPSYSTSYKSKILAQQTYIQLAESQKKNPLEIQFPVGKVIINVVPSPNWLSTSKLPSWLSMMA
jgi:hypothetical protein